MARFAFKGEGLRLVPLLYSSPASSGTKPDLGSMRKRVRHMNQSVTTETLKVVLNAFNRHDLDAITEFFAEDIVFDMPRGPKPWGQRFVGKAAVREGLAGRFAGIPDVHYGDDSHWVCDDRGVSEWTLTGTTTAGVRIEVRGCDLWEFCDGLIRRKDSYWKIVV